MPDDLAPDQRKTKTRAWFEALQERIIAACETLETEASGPFAPLHGARPVCRDALDADGPFRRRRRRRSHGGSRRPRLREDGGPYLDRVRHLPGRVRGPDSRRGGGPAVLGLGHLAHRASVEPECAHRPHEPALRRDDESLVRRRRRPHASSSIESIVDLASFGSVGRSMAVSRFFHFATVF